VEVENAMGDGRGALTQGNQTQQSNGTSKPKWKEKEREDSKEGNHQPINTVFQKDFQKTKIQTTIPN
jgi:hypothetical protein